MSGSPSILLKATSVSWVRQLMPVILTLWEAKGGGSQGQEIETILVNMLFLFLLLYTPSPFHQPRKLNELEIDPAKAAILLSSPAGVERASCFRITISMNQEKVARYQAHIQNGDKDYKQVFALRKICWPDAVAHAYNLSTLQANVGRSQGQVIETMLANMVEPHLY
ncbi:hypothetical protein AAY473_018776 [Plecturocebus cupreus]